MEMGLAELKFMCTSTPSDSSVLPSVKLCRTMGRKLMTHVGSLASHVVWTKVAQSIPTKQFPSALYFEQ